MASKLPCSAMAAPVRPAMSEWLWLVGMPKNHATVTPHDDGDHARRMSAMSAWCASPPKSTMLKMVWATAAVHQRHNQQ